MSIGYLFGTVIPPPSVGVLTNRKFGGREDADHRRQGSHDAKYLSKRY